MARAIQLASLAEGQTSPNPLVGAVVIDKNEKIVGDGFHARAGLPHAEVVALKQAGGRAKEGTLVVTLEPCCHFGKTPPCVETIIRAGISRVVIAMKDPDSRVSGQGIASLKEAGIEVLIGVLEQEAIRLNRSYIFRVKTGRPWGILKWAMSLDGRIALPNGASKWITSEESRKRVHSLRSLSDAVIIGGGTLRKDNPLLTSRGIKLNEPIRVVFSRSLNLPKDAQLWNTNIANSIIAFGPQSDQEKLEEIPEGPEKLQLRSNNPTALLKALAQKGCNRVLWECGPSLATEAINQNCVQELKVFIAPKLIGGLSAMTPLDDLGFTRMDQVFEMPELLTKKIGKDFLLEMLLDNS